MVLLLDLFKKICQDQSLVKHVNSQNFAVTQTKRKIYYQEKRRKSANFIDENFRFQVPTLNTKLQNTFVNFWSTTDSCFSLKNTRCSSADLSKSSPLSPTCSTRSLRLPYPLRPVPRPRKLHQHVPKPAKSFHIAELLTIFPNCSTTSPTCSRNSYPQKLNADVFTSSLV